MPEFCGIIVIKKPRPNEHYKVECAFSLMSNSALYCSFAHPTCDIWHSISLLWQMNEHHVACCKSGWPNEHNFVQCRTWIYCACTIHLKVDFRQKLHVASRKLMWPNKQDFVENRMLNANLYCSFGGGLSGTWLC